MTCAPSPAADMAAPTNSRRRLPQSRRRWWLTALVCLTVQLVAPSSAHAWWGWLDNLSGPGPFNGAEFDYKILCLMNQPSLEEPVLARMAFTAFEKTLSTRLAALALETAQRQATADGQKKLTLDRSTLTQLNDRVAAFVLDLDPKNIGDDYKGGPSSKSLEEIRSSFRGIFKTTSLTHEQETLLKTFKAGIETMSGVWRGARVPRTTTPHFGLWASCSDRLRHEMVGPGGDIVPKDRRPVISLVLNYRDLRNATLFHVFSDVARDGTSAIHLRILEPKLSWPLSGRFDFLDGQAGAGVYRFSSDSFRTGAQSFHGLVVEPIRFDLHAPGSLIEKWADHQNQPIGNFFRRLPLSVSYSAGVLLFPGGFSADRFIGDTPGVVGREISGGEAIFEQGIVINLGRLLKL